MMTKKYKLVDRFLSKPNDFHYNEVVRLVGCFGFEEIKTGNTSGSRVKFINSIGIPLILHKPHPSGIMKQYQLKQIKEKLDL